MEYRYGDRIRVTGGFCSGWKGTVVGREVGTDYLIRFGSGGPSSSYIHKKYLEVDRDSPTPETPEIGSHQDILLGSSITDEDTVLMFGRPYPILTLSRRKEDLSSYVGKLVRVDYISLGNTTVSFSIKEVT